jgi:hypothetical protein
MDPIEASAFVAVVAVTPSLILAAWLLWQAPPIW